MLSHVHTLLIYGGQIPTRSGAFVVASPRMIDAAHAHGQKVHFWVVNDPNEMERLLALGADGIITGTYAILR